MIGGGFISKAMRWGMANPQGLMTAAGGIGGYMATGTIGGVLAGGASGYMLGRGGIGSYKTRRGGGLYQRTVGKVGRQVSGTSFAYDLGPSTRMKASHISGEVVGSPSAQAIVPYNSGPAQSIIPHGSGRGAGFQAPTIRVTQMESAATSSGYRRNIGGKRAGAIMVGAGIGLIGGGAVGGATSAVGSSFGSRDKKASYGATFSGMGNGTVRGY